MTPTGTCTSLGSASTQPAGFLRSRDIRALGTDTFGPDLGIDPSFEVTTLVLGERRFTLENLSGLEQMPPNGAWILVSGPRNKKGSGASSTIFGLIR